MDFQKLYAKTDDDLEGLLEGAVEYTDCASVDGKDPDPTSVLDITQNNLMVRFY